MPAVPARVALLLLSSSLLLAGCSAPLSGRYEDINDSSRYYIFSKWSRSWDSYYEESGRYTVDGKVITLDANVDLTGEIVSADEFWLDDVPGFNEARPYNTYRRIAP
ncbi:hypothetical protein [Panacagrimonas sp.]|uniref:hypothetical protein n=1 Tax=Panacagrimonas sp. TaxID=2480088 RepID=UPI003B520A34